MESRELISDLCGASIELKASYCTNNYSDKVIKKAIKVIELAREILSNSIVIRKDVFDKMAVFYKDKIEFSYFVEQKHELTENEKQDLIDFLFQKCKYEFRKKELEECQ